jgi:hypothetical protein
VSTAVDMRNELLQFLDAVEQALAATAHKLTQLGPPGVAGGQQVQDNAVGFFEVVEAAFDDVAVVGNRRVEGVGASAGGSPPFAVGELVGAFGDGYGDPAAGQRAAVGCRGVPLVTQHRLGRPGPRRGMWISVSVAPSMRVSLTLPLVSPPAPAVAGVIRCRPLCRRRTRW